jgi:hypothetical protein
MIHGADRTLSQFRDLAFQTTGDALRRPLRMDALLAGSRIDDARRGMRGVAWTFDSTLEDDAGGATLPPTDRMRDSIAGIRVVVADYCGSKAAIFHESSRMSVCKELAARR